MRLKAFTAPTMSLAMARVRETLGEDAIIISTRNGNAESGITVTAAIEESQHYDPFAFSQLDAEATPLDAVDEVLDFHRIPPIVADPLRTAAASLNSDNPVALLAGAIDMQFSFRPLESSNLNGPIILIGPPGAGKTVAAAKIAAGALLAGKPVRLVTTDTGRAGGAARLRALAERLGLPLEEASDRDTLDRCLAHTANEAVIIDTPGINPLSDEEYASLDSFLSGLAAPITLVLPAGTDAYDGAELAVAFAALGAGSIIASRLDAALRYGGLLTAARATKLPFAASGIHPQIGDGLAPLNPMSLARLMVARNDGSPSPFGDQSWLTS